MKLQITEEQLKTIIGNISEQIVSGKGRDPWQYKKNGDRYFVAKKNTNSWPIFIAFPSQPMSLTKSKK